MGWTIDSGIYFDAAKKCQLLASDISLALGPLLSTLVHECGGMAGNHEKCQAWITAYDQYASDIVQLTAALANALQRYGDVLAATGYNWWQANRSTTSGAEPTRPTESELLYDTGMDLPATAKGDNGSGIDSPITGLLEKVGKIPNGDVTKLHTAAEAWKTFSEHTNITGAAERIKGINAKFADSTDPNIIAIEEKLSTLQKAAELLAQAAKALYGPVQGHYDALDKMRSDIQKAVSDANKELAASIAVTIAVVGVLAVVTGGVAAGPAAAGGAAVTTEVVTATAAVIRTAVHASDLIHIYEAVTSVGSAGSGVFSAIPDLAQGGTKAALDGIAAMTVKLTDGGSSGNQWDKVEGAKPNPANITISHKRRIHILDGDGSDDINGGGHAPGTGMPNKTEFPDTDDWEDDKIIDRIVDVAKNPDQPPVLQDNGNWKVNGTRNGVQIEVIVAPDGSVVTGYPIGGEGVVRNDANGDPIK
ncbi:EndoU domain-containing protein [Nocardia sp. NPDC004573]